MSAVTEAITLPIEKYSLRDHLVLSLNSLWGEDPPSWIKFITAEFHRLLPFCSTISYPHELCSEFYFPLEQAAALLLQNITLTAQEFYRLFIGAGICILVDAVPAATESEESKTIHIIQILLEKNFAGITNSKDLEDAIHYYDVQTIEAKLPQRTPPTITGGMSSNSDTKKISSFEQQLFDLYLSYQNDAARLIAIGKCFVEFLSYISDERIIHSKLMQSFQRLISNLNDLHLITDVNCEHIITGAYLEIITHAFFNPYGFPINAIRDYLGELLHHTFPPFFPKTTITNAKYVFRKASESHEIDLVLENLPLLSPSEATAALVAKKNKAKGKLHIDPVEHTDMNGIETKSDQSLLPSPQAKLKEFPALDLTLVRQPLNAILEKYQTGNSCCLFLQGKSKKAHALYEAIQRANQVIHSSIVDYLIYKKDKQESIMEVLQESRYGIGKTWRTRGWKTLEQNLLPIDKIRLAILFEINRYQYVFINSKKYRQLRHALHQAEIAWQCKEINTVENFLYYQSNNEPSIAAVLQKHRIGCCRATKGWQHIQTVLNNILEQILEPQIAPPRA